MSNKNKPTLQKLEKSVQQIHAQTIQGQEPQRQPTPEEVIDFSDRKLVELDNQIKQHVQNFVAHHHNILMNTAMMLFNTAYAAENWDPNESNLDRTLDLAFKFTEKALSRQEDFQQKIAEKFVINDTILDLQAILNEKKQNALKEIEERDIAQKAAREEIQKLREQEQKLKHEAEQEKLEAAEEAHDEGEKDERTIN